MPSLIDMLEIAEALESKAVFVAQDRCVVVRNRNVTCRKCEQACPSHVLSLQGNTLELKSSLCSACGACTTVCPTEALIPLRPLDEELAALIADACSEAEGEAIFACARSAARRLADPVKYAEVPCLARMEEGVLIALVAQGISHITLVDGDCTTCRYRACNEGIQATIESATTLLEAMGILVELKRASAFPEKIKSVNSTTLHGVSRRRFFSQARGSAKGAAEKTIATVLKTDKQKMLMTLRERLSISDEGTLPQFDAKRRMGILDALDSLGAPQVSEIKTRLWGKVFIDKERCSACGMCAVFCPTGALKKLEAKETENNQVAIEFSLADCVQCRACEDICLKQCLVVEDVISLEELFDFEPCIIPLSSPEKKKGILTQKG